LNAFQFRGHSPSSCVADLFVNGTLGPQTVGNSGGVGLRFNIKTALEASPAGQKRSDLIADPR
jgi:hypothetical protein